MKPRHTDCQDTKCSICLNDAMTLEKILEKRTGTGKQYDLLSRYHSWLGNNNIKRDTEWGWISEEAYLDNNINRFCSEMSA